MKRLIPLFSVLSSAFLFASSAGAATITATQDSIIRSGNPNASDSSNNLVLVGNVTSSDYIRGLFQFNLSSVAGQTSTGSNLTFTITNTDAASVSANVTLGLYLVTATGVNVNSATWNSSAWSTPGGAVGADYSATPLATLTLNPRNVTTYSQLVFSSASLDSLLTSTAASGGTLTFALIAIPDSSSGEGSANRGIFRIGSSEETYTANPVPAGPRLNFIPEPSTALASCMGLALLLVRRRK